MKPKLTAKVVKQLRSVAAYTECEADSLSFAGDAEQQKEAKELLAGSDWLQRLCNWYDQQKREKAKCS